MLTQFWLRAASGPLDLSAPVHWTFMVDGAEDDVQATRLDDPERIAWTWSDGTSVDVHIEPFVDDPAASSVTIEHDGFAGDVDDAIATAVESTQGFTLVLSNLKLLLETGAPGNLVSDKAALITASARETPAAVTPDGSTRSE